MTQLSHALHWWSRCLLLAALAGTSAEALADQFDIPGPDGSSAFGSRVAVLPNGNFVVQDLRWPGSNRGAVYLYDTGGELISALTGGSDDDRIGSGGLRVLPSGDFLVHSPEWNNPDGGATKAGAVTWVDGQSGRAGVVSVANSLVGSSPRDGVGSGVTVLTNGNYVVGNPNWTHGVNLAVGAATWAPADGSLIGVVSASNSLIGMLSSDQIGKAGIVPLSNGHYVVASGDWSNGSIAKVGAVTWADGTMGRVGLVSPANSLIGSQNFDGVGGLGVLALRNGNYLVRSSFWDNGALANAGAVTWASGDVGLVGIVSAQNSLVGSSTQDLVGNVVELANGHYVVWAHAWDGAAGTNVGAVMWGDGDAGVMGTIGPDRGLVGGNTNALIGIGGVTPLSNGHYVVSSFAAHSGFQANVGSVTWAHGGGGTLGEVSASNSLMGRNGGDEVGRVFALPNGNYVVSAKSWRNDAGLSVGAVIWADGNGGTAGPVSEANALIGSHADDAVGQYITVLANSHVVIGSPGWDNGSVVNVGAATWMDGRSGRVGLVTADNSLIGSNTDDQIGSSGIAALSNGHYVVSSSRWDSGQMENVGAVTWRDGWLITTGQVAASNSLIGSAPADQVGAGFVSTNADGSFAVGSPSWDNGAFINAGAVTLLHGQGPTVAVVEPIHSVLGMADNAGVGSIIVYDLARQRLLVGRAAENKASVLTLRAQAGFANGFE